MKRNHRIFHTLILTLATASVSIAQPQLTTDDIPAVGDKKTDYKADTVGVEPGPAGANVTWDFSTISRVSSNDSVNSEVLAASGTPYASDYPTANIAGKGAGGNSWFYYTSTSTTVSLVGLVSINGSTTIKQFYTNPQLHIKVPLTYNESYSDDYGANYVANGITIYRTGTVTTTADAYGTIIMPHRTFPNVLRIKMTSFMKDSFEAFEDEWFVTTYESTTYSFISPGRQSTILSVIYLSMTQQGFPSGAGKTVIFNDIEPLASAGDLSILKSDLKVFPNPASGNTAIRIDAKQSAAIQIRICNTMGQRVHEQTENIQPGNTAISLPVNNLTPGIYFVNVSDGIGTATRKLIIE